MTAPQTTSAPTTGPATSTPPTSTPPTNGGAKASPFSPAVQQYTANIIVPRSRLTPEQQAERDACTAKLAAKRDAVVAAYLKSAVMTYSGCEGEDPLVAAGAMNADNPNTPASATNASAPNAEG